jgi:hypothetical protein
VKGVIAWLCGNMACKIEASIVDHACPFKCSLGPRNTDIDEINNLCGGGL